MDGIELHGTAGETLTVDGDPDQDGEIPFRITVSDCTYCERDAYAYLGPDERRALVAHLNRVDGIE